MHIRVDLFGVTRDIVGGAHLQYEATGPLSVKALLADLKGRYPALGRLSSLAVAVNSEYAEGDLQLAESDEVALIPPVSGG
jgi:molybdopterin synthase sulfur carrier subunit